MAIKNIQLAVTRNDFYYKSYTQVARLTALLFLVTILLIGFYLYQSKSFTPLPMYFPTTPDGKLIEMPPESMNQLLLSDQTITDSGQIVGMPEPKRTYDQLKPDGENALIKWWTYLAVKDMFDYDYIHYRGRIQQSSKYFTPSGHDRFIEALVGSRNLETVKLRSAIVIPEIVGPIEIVSTRLIEVKGKDHFVWDIEVPLQLTYESAANTDPIVQNLLATLSIARVSTLKNPFYGTQIYQLNFEQVFESEG